MQEPIINKEDLELIFSFARSHSATVQPTNENQMIHIIKIKQELFEQLFDKKEVKGETKDKKH